MSPGGLVLADERARPGRRARNYVLAVVAELRGRARRAPRPGSSRTRWPAPLLSPPTTVTLAGILSLDVEEYVFEVARALDQILGPQPKRQRRDAHTQRWKDVEDAADAWPAGEIQEAVYRSQELPDQVEELIRAEVGARGTALVDYHASVLHMLEADEAIARLG